MARLEGFGSSWLGDGSMVEEEEGCEIRARRSLARWTAASGEGHSSLQA